MLWSIVPITYYTTTIPCLGSIFLSGQVPQGCRKAALHLSLLWRVIFTRTLWQKFFELFLEGQFCLGRLWISGLQALLSQSQVAFSLGVQWGGGGFSV